MVSPEIAIAEVEVVVVVKGEVIEVGMEETVEIEGKIEEALAVAEEGKHA